MHDPLVIAFEIRRPWPQRSSFGGPNSPRWEWTIYRAHGADHQGWNPRRWWRPGSWSPFVTVFGRRFFFPPVLTVWHVEPGGRDSGEVCKHYRRWQDDAGQWHMKSLRAWRWHVWHWRIQVPPLQDLRRRLFQRCAWCNGPSRKGHVVNVSHQWDSGPAKPWWSSKPHLYHSGCSSAMSVFGACLCDVPTVEGWNGAHGVCTTCGKSYRGEAVWIGHRQAVDISGHPVEGEPWTWPSEVNCHDIAKRLDAEREAKARP